MPRQTVCGALFTHGKHSLKFYAIEAKNPLKYDI